MINRLLHIRAIRGSLFFFILVALPALAQTNALAPDDPFPKLSAGDLVKILSTSEDKARTAQVAQALGDRTIAGPLKLSDEEAKTLHAVVTTYIQNARSPATMKEADLQIQRLWHLAMPALMDGLDNIDTYSFSARCLSIMKNETIARALVEKTQKTTDNTRKGLLKFALQSLKSLRTPSVAGRAAVSQTEADRLNREIITPALEELQ